MFQHSGRAIWTDECMLRNSLNVYCDRTFILVAGKSGDMLGRLDTSTTPWPINVFLFQSLITLYCTQYFKRNANGRENFELLKDVQSTLLRIYRCINSGTRPNMAAAPSA
ncbi:hypothetical protein AVEN_53016-1 [Araneus ventricosus]|uniref:Uncharacterized protein n=1 Tax=Araneus ventricosus TaxID=182803 RepID=A0A4Y2GCM5_ARAVE|nr:hypothetical protein AVEN_53016-1 [Araneus ventricosus]